MLLLNSRLYFVLSLEFKIFSCVCACVQGNFFQNIGSITLFAVIGTAISAFIVGGGIYFLGQVRIQIVNIQRYKFFSLFLQSACQYCEC